MEPDIAVAPSGDGDGLDVAAEILGPHARGDVSLAGLTTYRAGGPAALLLEARDLSDLELAARALAAGGLDVLVLGRGSNLLVADAGFPGLVVTLGEGFADVVIEGTAVRAGGACPLPVLARRSAASALTGLEWAVGVPGSVGGGVRMNAGGHGSEIAGCLTRAWVFDLHAAAADSDSPSSAATEMAAAELNFGYRRSAVAPGCVVVEAEFALAPTEREVAEARVAEIVRWRREHQPGGANAGSVFANPPGDSAGRLIEAAGAKGLRRGSAFVSPKHANFFQVDADGSADDVVALMVDVQALVRDRMDVVLVPEVQLVGFPEPVRALLSSGGSA